jgi:hypothetical protein
MRSWKKGAMTPMGVSSSMDRLVLAVMHDEEDEVVDEEGVRVPCLSGWALVSGLLARGPPSGGSIPVRSDTTLGAPADPSPRSFGQGFCAASGLVAARLAV